MEKNCELLEWVYSVEKLEIARTESFRQMRINSRIPLIGRITPHHQGHAHSQALGFSRCPAIIPG